MGLLQEIQDDAVNPTVDLATILRKCLRLSYKLGHEPFKRWVEYELNGYPDDADLPDYRILRGEPRGTARNVAWQISNTQIPRSAIPQEYREMATTALFRQGVAYFPKDTGEDVDKVFWPRELVDIVNQSIARNLPLVEGYIPVPKGFFAGMLDVVRTRMLEFSLKIEAENPEADQAVPGKPPIPQERINAIFHMTFNNSQVGVGGTFHQIDKQVVAGDLESLHRALREIGLDEGKIEELDEILAENPDPAEIESEQGRFGRWLKSAVTTAKDVGVPAATQLIIAAVKAHFGIP